MQMNKAILRNSEIEIFDKKIISRPPGWVFFSNPLDQKQFFFSRKPNWHPLFIKLTRKHFKGIISGLHFTTFVNILPKLKYFEGRNYIQIG